MTAAALFVAKPADGSKNMDVQTQCSRILYPFIGALVAQIFFNFQVRTINDMNSKDSGEPKHVELMLDKFDESKEISSPSVNVSVD